MASSLVVVSPFTLSLLPSSPSFPSESITSSAAGVEGVETVSKTVAFLAFLEALQEETEGFVIFAACELKESVGWARVVWVDLRRVGGILA